MKCPETTQIAGCLITRRGGTAVPPEALRKEWPQKQVYSSKPSRVATWLTR
jgi:hypothetical protein